MSDYQRVKHSKSSLSSIKAVERAQARKDFFRLVDSLSSGNSAIKITDHGEPVAVLISYQNYVALTEQTSVNAGNTDGFPSLVGSITINADLDSETKSIADMFNEALAKSSASL